MKITAVHVKDFKRIHEIKIEPAADSYILVIGGPNANGKTSLLDAITVAIGGKSEVPADPVRHGAEQAEIDIRTDTGLAIKRTIAPDGASKLEVRDELGAMKSPQAVLDKLVAGRFLDPLQFLALKPGDQRAELLRLVDRDGKVIELDHRRSRVFDRRTEIGRDLKKISAQVDAMVPVDPAQPIDVNVAMQQSRGHGERLRELDGRRYEHDGASRRLGLAMSQREAREHELKQAEVSLHAARDAEMRAQRDVDEAALRLPGPEDIANLTKWRDEADAKIREATAHNATVEKLRAHEQQRGKLVADRDRLAAEVATRSEELEKIDAEKAAILGAAQLPVPGLGVAADGVTLAGVPLAQASGAERLRVALALAIAANPQLRDVWVRDGALLDEESLTAVAEHARAAGVRVWVERVGVRDPGAIVIQDGRVRDAVVETANTSQGSLFQ